MVSKASEDLPDPDTPVTTVRVLWSTVTSMFLRLWTRAPRTTMLSVDISTQETTRLPPENEPPLSKSSQKELASLRNLSIIRQEPQACQFLLRAFGKRRFVLWRQAGCLLGRDVH